MKRSIKKILLSTATLGTVVSLSSVLLTSCVYEEGSYYDGPVDIKLKWSKLGYNENAEAGQAGMSVGWIGASVLPETTDQSVDYTLVIPESKKDQPGWVIPSWLSLKQDDEGHTHIAWTQEVNSSEGNSGVYNFCIGAFSKKNMSISATTAWNIRLTVNNPNVKPTSVVLSNIPTDLTEYIGQSGHYNGQMMAQCLPQDSDQEVTWSKSGSGCDNISVSNGLITWTAPATQTETTYTLTVTATSKVDSTILASKSITVHVSKPLAKSVTITYTGGSAEGQKWTVKPYTAGSSYGHFDLTVDPENASAPNIKFGSITGFKSPSGLNVTSSIGPTKNSYIAHWDDKNGPGEYGFKVYAIADGVTSNEYIVTMTINPDPVTPGSITINTDTGLGLNGLLYTEGSAQNPVTASLLPATADQAVTWSIVDDSTSGKIGITPTNGIIRWGNIGNEGDYTFKVKATSVADPTVNQTSDELTLNIKKPDPTGMTITYNGTDLNNPTIQAVIGEAGSLNGTFQASIEPAGSDQDVTWSVDSADASNPLPTEIRMKQVGNEGILYWDGIQDTTPSSLIGKSYKVLVKATSALGLSRTYSKNITFYVNDWYTEGNSGSVAWRTHSGTINTYNLNQFLDSVLDARSYMTLAGIQLDGAHIGKDVLTSKIAYKVTGTRTDVGKTVVYTNVASESSTGAENPLPSDIYSSFQYDFHNDKVVFSMIKSDGGWMVFPGAGAQHYKFYFQLGLYDKNENIHWIHSKNSQNRYTFYVADIGYMYR